MLTTYLRFTQIPINPGLSFSLFSNAFEKSYEIFRVGFGDGVGVFSLLSVDCGLSKTLEKSYGLLLRVGGGDGVGVFSLLIVELLSGRSKYFEKS